MDTAVFLGVPYRVFFSTITRSVAASATGIANQSPIVPITIGNNSNAITGNTIPLNKV